jgi:hypothetical protein
MSARRTDRGISRSDVFLGLTLGTFTLLLLPALPKLPEPTLAQQTPTFLQERHDERNLVRRHGHIIFVIIVVPVRLQQRRGRSVEAQGKGEVEVLGIDRRGRGEGEEEDVNDDFLVDFAQVELVAVSWRCCSIHECGEV